MCSPMPDIDPDEDDGPPACFRYPHCEAHEACGWPACSETDAAAAEDWETEARALDRKLDAARARIAELEAENERLRAMRRHDLNAWKYDPNGPVTQ